MSWKDVGIFGLIIVLGPLVLSEPVDLPTIKLFQVDQNNKIIKRWTKINNEREAILEDVESIRLECTAEHPVQWVYTGVGIPVMTTSLRFSRSKSAQEVATEYKAEALITPLKEHHTGKYACSSADHLDLSTFLYLYVPGQALFTSLEGKTIHGAKNDSKVIIPCSVSHPDVVVTLERAVGEVIDKIRIKSGNAIQYDPKVGFTVDLLEVEDPEGTYICTAKYGNRVRGIEYTVIPNESLGFGGEKEPTEDNENAQSDETCRQICGETRDCKRIDGRLQCVDKLAAGRCEAHTDCPDDMSCYTDRRCRNPCINSLVRCGEGSKCRVENHRPVCYCPKDFVGDPKKHCFYNIQSSDPNVGIEKKPETPEKPAEGRPEPQKKGKTCSEDNDCSEKEQCYRPRPKQPKICIDPCSGPSRCGRFARCVSSDHSPRCECLPGFTGNPSKQCSPMKSEEKVVQNKPEKLGNQESSRPCDIKVCGENSKCITARGKIPTCVCRKGFEGYPPNCVPKCDANNKCRTNEVCLKSAETGYPVCVDICGSKLCGAHAKCNKNSFECTCPFGHVGDPYKVCRQVSASALTNIAKIESNCKVDSDCGRGLRCKTGPNYRKCVDPCMEKECPAAENLECVTERHTSACVCKIGYTGSEALGCTKNVGLDDVFGETIESPCKRLNCGENSECRLLGGTPRCFCLVGFVGSPPNCMPECRTSAQCSWDKRCVEGRCRSGSEGDCDKCGINTKCKLSIGGNHEEPVCSCLDGYDGDPLVECFDKGPVF